MRITPLDVRQQQFTVRMFRGFDVQEVDAFLQDVAEDYETILKENALLKEQLAVLEERRAEEARIRADMHSLKLLHRQLAESVKVAVERYLRLADADLGEAGT